MDHLDTLLIMLAFGFVDYYILEELQLAHCKENFEKFAQVTVLALVNFFVYGLIDTHFVGNDYALYFISFVAVLILGWAATLAYGTLKHRPHTAHMSQLADRAKETSEHLFSKVGKRASEEEAIFGFPGKLSAHVFDYSGHFLAAGLVDDTPAQWNDDNFELLLEPFEEAGASVTNEKELLEELQGEAYRIYLDTKHQVKVYLHLVQEEEVEEVEEEVESEEIAFASKQEDHKPEVVKEVPQEPAE